MTTDVALFLLAAVLIGTGATAVLDLWHLARARLLGGPFFNYGLLGRWLIYLIRGRFRHDPIAATPSVAGERLLGWAAHYGIGIAFAGLLLAIWGLEWLRHPTPGAALMVGIGTALAPFLVLQPAFGLGIAARRTLRPNAARAQTLITHVVFGLGLYVAGWLICLLLS